MKHEIADNLMTNTSTEPIWTLTAKGGDSPVFASAIHDGHAIRPEVVPYLALAEDERLREEDPFTGEWASVAETFVVGLQSRFEVDLNRPRDKAIYHKPEDAWGLKVFSKELPEELIETTLAQYDAFYAAMKDFFAQAAEKHGHFVLLDLHTYNHRRDGPEAKPASNGENPEVNLGTATMKNRDIFEPLVQGFIADLHGFDYDGGSLDVRENVKFKGGNFARWIHETFPENACVLSVEFKKFFMDEWTGKADIDQLGMVHSALDSTINGLCEALKALK